MTIQHRRRASLNKAIGDILAVDAKTPMSSILEQLTAMFPNISSPGFEGIQMQAWIGDQVEAYRKTHEQTSGGHPTAVEEHSTGDPLVNTEGLSGSEANVAVASNSEPGESQSDRHPLSTHPPNCYSTCFLP